MDNLKSTSEIIFYTFIQVLMWNLYAILRTLFNAVIYDRCFLVFVGPGMVDLHRKQQLEMGVFLW